MLFTLEPFYPNTPAFLEAVSAYQIVWGGYAEPMYSTIEFFVRQASYPDWSGFVARAENGALLGFAFGSSVATGQWWYDHLQSHLVLKQTWCLVELGVLEAARRQGVAQALHDALLQQVKQPRVALSTQINNIAALEFYRKNGYQTLLEQIEFTPGQVFYTILGKELLRISEHGQRARAGGFILRSHAGQLEVLLMKRFKPERGEYFVIPGGSVETGETFEQSATRELREETNLQFHLEQKLYESINPSSARTAHYFIAKYHSGEPSLHPHAPESLERQDQFNRYTPTWVQLEQIEHIPLFPSAIRQRLARDLRNPPVQTVQLEEYD